MNILISGGSGFLGHAFSKYVQRQQGVQARITWLTRDPNQAHPDYISMMGYDELQVTQKTFDVVLNLAGAGIADARWTDKRKRELFESRLQPTQAILDYIARISVKPKLLVSGSAIGWYGNQGDKPLDELSPAASQNHKAISNNKESDFAHALCDRWETEAKGASAFGVDVVLLRTGVVIHPEGGMLSRLITPFKLGTGGQLGNGQQIMSWISREDWVRATWFIIEKQVAYLASKPDSKQATVYNLTSPNPVTNSKFTKAVGHWLNRPTFMTLPAWVLKTMFGDMSTLLLDGQKVLPQALLTEGFEFKHLSIEQALEEQA